MPRSNMTRRKIIGVLGRGDGASERDIALAYELGKLIAEQGFVLLSGGRAVGVMDSVNKGAKSAGGLTIGIIPRTSDTISEAVDIVIVTDMGSARNNINVLSSDALIACGTGGAGTASEIALALKSGKHVVLLQESEEACAYFTLIGRHLVHVAATPAQAVQIVSALFDVRA
jgi:uncharacterized protein (TIGR00725 family)